MSKNLLVFAVLFSKSQVLQSFAVMFSHPDNSIASSSLDALFQRGCFEGWSVLDVCWMFIKHCQHCYLCRLSVTEDGKKALITLANGDMRKVLNILQVIFLFIIFYSVNCFLIINFQSQDGSHKSLKVREKHCPFFLGSGKSLKTK